jgi:tetratricopeptide (TPR) repeat protein
MMSLLADLLSKINQSQPKREVPPNLKNIVQNSPSIMTKKKIFILSILFVSSVVAGLALVHFVRSLQEASKGDIVNSVPVTKKVIKAENREYGQVEKGKTAISSTMKVENTPVIPDSTKKSPNNLLSASESIQKDSIPDRQDTLSEVLNEPEKGDMIGNSEEKREEENEILSLKTEHIDIAKRDSYLYSAGEMEKEGNYAAALSLYKKALEIDPDNLVLINNVAYMYLKLNLLEESIEYSRAALDRYDEYTPALINLGIAYAETGDVSSAENYLDRAFRLEPENEAVLLNLAILNEKQGDYSQAKEYYTRLIGLGNVEGSLGLARIYERQGNVEEALVLYRKVYSSKSVNERARTEARQRIMLLLNKVNSINTFKEEPQSIHRQD